MTIVGEKGPAEESVEKEWKCLPQQQKVCASSNIVDNFHEITLPFSSSSYPDDDDDGAVVVASRGREMCAFAWEIKFNP